MTSNLFLVISGVVCIALLYWVLHLFVSDYEDTMEEVRKLDGDEDVLLKWLGEKDGKSK